MGWQKRSINDHGDPDEKPLIHHFPQICHLFCLYVVKLQCH